MEKMHGERLLRLNQVEEVVGYKKSKIYELVKDGFFPQPVKLGTRAVRWRESAISQWIDSLPLAKSHKVAQQ